MSYNMVDTYLVYTINMTNPLFKGFNIGNIKNSSKIIKMFGLNYI